MIPMCISFSEKGKAEAERGSCHRAFRGGNYFFVEFMRKSLIVNLWLTGKATFTF